MLIQCAGKLTCIIPDITFGNILNQEELSNNCVVTRAEKVSAADFSLYNQAFNVLEYISTGQNQFGQCEFHAYLKDNLAVFLSYYPATKQMRIVCEWDSLYAKHMNKHGSVTLASTERWDTSIHIIGRKKSAFLFTGKRIILEVPPRFELGNESFADSCLTTWPRYHMK